MFKGSNVALITPFKNDKLDEEAYIKLIHFQINNGMRIGDYEKMYLKIWLFYYFQTSLKNGD